MLEKGLCLVLRQHEGRGDVRVDEVAQDEIHDPILAPEGYRGLAPLRGKRMQALSSTAGKDQRQDPCFSLEVHR
jgi:hypothetical protein